MSCTKEKSTISLVYDRGEGRHKHRWNKDEAGFEPSGSGAVGKCHKSITKDIAEGILRRGVYYYEQQDDSFPAKIYGVYRGVVYEAVPTLPEVSWHGYPWRGDLAGRRKLSKKITKQLIEIAKKENCHKECEEWLKKYS